MPFMKRFRIRITSGQQAGRYVGPNIGGGLITNPELQANREVKVPGTSYSLYAQPRAATEFMQGNPEAVQAELKRFGLDSELVEIDILDSLAGMSLSDPRVEEKVLRICQSKLADQPALDCVHLLFGGDEEVMVERNETVASLKAKLDKIRGEGRSKIESHGS